MRSPPRARAAFLLLYGALLAWQIDRWLLTAHGLVSTWAHADESTSVTTASPRGVTQTFTMGADGLDGVWLRPLVHGGTPHGELVVDLMTSRGDHPVRRERVSIAAAAIPGHGAWRIPFRPVRASRGGLFTIAIRHVHAGDGPAIRLATTREDGLPAGRLVADGTEQWGDLIFETSSRRATLPYWLHEVLRPWPAWLHAWPVVTLVLLACNGLLAWACGSAIGLLGEPVPMQSPPTRASFVTRSGASRRPAAAVSVATLAVLLVAVAGAAMASRPTGRYRALDLIDALPEARTQSTWGRLHSAVSPGPVLFGARVHRAIVAMPPSSVSWTVEVPRDAVLRLGAAMRPDMWDRRSDGIEMRVHIDHAGGRTTAAALTLFPMGVPAHRQLFPIEVPLTSWAGQRITIVLETTPERWGNAVNDVPVWTAPRIEWPRNPAAGTARIIQNSQ